MEQLEQRGPGRPKGSKERSKTKRQTRLRVRLHRERKAEEAEDTRVSQEKLFKDMRAEGLLFFGETSPLVNCINIAEEVEMARLWAKLLNMPDIRPGQNQKNYILEIMKAWCSANCPLLHLESLTLSERFVAVPDIEAYIWFEGSDAPYQAVQQ